MLFPISNSIKKKKANSVVVIDLSKERSILFHPSTGFSCCFGGKSRKELKEKAVCPYAEA